MLRCMSLFWAKAAAIGIRPRRRLSGDKLPFAPWSTMGAFDPQRCAPGSWQRINAEHLLTTPLRPADLLFVFGTRDGVIERIDAAHRLWHDGYCEWLLVSGGLTPGSHLTECEIIKAGLVSRGVPAH